MPALHACALRSGRFARWMAAALAAVALGASAAEISVTAPKAVKESITEIAARFEGETGHRVVFSWGGSESIARRVSGGEAFDIVVNTAQNIQRFSGEGRVAKATRTDFARSPVGVAVRSGLPKPDVSTVDALRAALLGANSIAISSGASGRYLEQLFQRMGIADQLRSRIRQPPSGAQIGELIARGEADLGFQQASELIHAPGVDYLGPLPAEIQNHTVWSAALHSSATQPEAARAFLRALVAPAAAAPLRRMGMEPP